MTSWITSSAPDRNLLSCLAIFTFMVLILLGHYHQQAGKPMIAVPPPRTAPAIRVVAAILGNALEFYDFTVYAAFAAMIGRTFFPASS
ncbi:MAG: hypothetical protein ACRYHQ_06095, partial [Janthinobacterium lividum]